MTESTVTTEVQEDGTTKVTQVNPPAGSSYQFNNRVVRTKLPDVPTSENLAKLFTPRYVLEVTADDGTVIPFVYRHLDPSSLLLTTGKPVSVNVDIKEKAQELSDQLQEISEKEESSPLEALSLLHQEGSQDLLQQALDLRKNTLKTGVISPPMTDELYENLDDEVLEALYEAITGGVTSDTELVETFSDGTEETST